MTHGINFDTANSNTTKFNTRVTDKR
ncbi:MAG TPA: hypothetical protein ACHBX0_13585 [Arsenophonus sp.]